VSSDQVERVSVVDHQSDLTGSGTALNSLLLFGPDVRGSLSPRVRWAQGIHLKGLILAQNERWRRGLGMQVEREGFLRETGQRQTG
jgi:hypothetical protein